VDALISLLAIAAAACALILAFVINHETSKLGAKVRVDQDRTLAWLGRAVVSGHPALPNDFPNSYVESLIRPSVDSIMRLYRCKSRAQSETASERLDSMIARDSVPVLLALKGLLMLRRPDRPRALRHLVWAADHTEEDEDGIRLVGYGYAGLVLADSGVHLDDTAVGHDLLRQAQVYYDAALVDDAAGIFTALNIVSWRERVRKKLGEDRKDVDRAGASDFAKWVFTFGLVCCLLGAGAAIRALALSKPR
jgi:hypothetical protein